MTQGARRWVWAGAVALGLLVGLLVLSTGSDPDGEGEPGATTVGSTVPVAPAWQIVPLQGRPSAADWFGPAGIVVVDDELGLAQLVDQDDFVVTPSGLGGPQVAVSVTLDDEIWAVDPGGVVTRSVAGVAQRFDVGGALVDVVADDSGAYVGDIEGSRVLHLTPAGEVDAELAVPDGVVRLALGAGDAHRLWVTGRDHTVTPIDLATREVLPSVPVGNGPIDVFATLDAVWVANGDDGTLSRLDPLTGARIGPDIRVGGGPVAVAPLGDSVWVLAQDAGLVVRVDVESARVVHEIPIPAEMSRARALVVTLRGVSVIGVDQPMLAFLPYEDARGEVSGP